MKILPFKVIALSATQIIVQLKINMNIIIYSFHLN